MSIIKRASCPTDGYEIIPRKTLQDREIPLDALGLLCYLLSLPPNWELRVAVLREELRIGKEKLARLLRTLETTGYLVRERGHSQDGRWEWVSIVYPEPITIAGFSGDGSTVHGSSVSGKASYINNTNKEITDIYIKQQPQDYSVDDLIFPVGLSTQAKGSITAMIAGVPIKPAQELLNELAGAAAQGRIRTSLPQYFRGLLRNYRAGTFCLAAGTKVAEQHAEGIPHDTVSKPASKANARQHLVKISSILSGRCR